MQVKISKPELPDDFMRMQNIARGKELSHTIVESETALSLVVVNSSYKAGHFVFHKEGDKLILTNRFIADRGCYPFEYAISILLARFKRKKIKYLLWN